MNHDSKAHISMSEATTRFGFVAMITTYASAGVTSLLDEELFKGETYLVIMIPTKLKDVPDPIDPSKNITSEELKRRFDDIITEQHLEAYTVYAPVVWTRKDYEKSEKHERETNIMHNTKSVLLNMGGILNNLGYFGSDGAK